MPASTALAEDRYRRTQALIRSTVAAMQPVWMDAKPQNIVSAIAGSLGYQLLSSLIAGQLSAVADSQSYVMSAMLAQGAESSPLGALLPTAFAGHASDGRPLDSLLFLPALTTVRMFTGGASPASAMLAGFNQLASIFSTQIADASRTATQVAMTAEPSVTSYVRVVRAPACARCLILSGRQYSYSTGFKRHPRCDCGMEPMSDDQWRKQPTAEDLVAQMSSEQRRKAFGTAGAEALDNGADIGQVVNARRGMTTTTTGKKVTTEGTTKRGIAGKSMKSPFQKVAGSRYQRTVEARLLPEQIISNAKGDRDLQVALLRKHGYIT